MEQFKQLDGYYYVIYKIINNENNKYYIGKHKTKNLDDGYMGSGSVISKAIKKYGKNSFSKEYLFFLTNEQECLNKEKELITEEILNDENCYNVSLGGKGDLTIARKVFYDKLKVDTIYQQKIYSTKKFVKNNPSKLKLTKEELQKAQDLYDNEKLSLRALGKIFNVSSSMFIYLNKQNLFKLKQK